MVKPSLREIEKVLKMTLSSIHTSIDQDLPIYSEIENAVKLEMETETQIENEIIIE